MQNIIRKLTSRKLWLAIAGVVTGIATILGAEGSDIQAVAGAVTSLFSAITYIVVEGRVDEVSVANAAEAVEDVAETMNKVGF